MTEALTQFQWEPQPEAQKIVNRLVEDHLQKCSEANELAEAMLHKTGTRFADWVDTIIVHPQEEEALIQVGFTVEAEEECPMYGHEGGIFPKMMIAQGNARGMYLKVESVADFMATHCLQGEILGVPFGQMRSAQIASGEDTELWVVERHGWPWMADAKTTTEKALQSQVHLETLRARRRAFPESKEAFVYTEGLVDAVIADLGVDWAADLWFAAERDYWMRRNRAARVQKARQDALGLGWANHDHHTYRCHRQTFHHVIALFEKLGCFCRERFYAGAEAGWGAQVLEHPKTGIVIFADVDMSPEEVHGDFAHHGFQPKEDLGTVGLWCALHGQSLFEAGMHHLECQFHFDELREQLRAEADVGMMDPFTNFPFLRQQFTEGERWKVDPQRIEKLLANDQISAEQAESFREQGAIGSHLENLERNDGYKGFNQQGVSEIIAGTDPRMHLAR